MRTIIALLLLTSKLLSQDISGEWKVISYEDETACFDIENDSVQFVDKSNQDPENLKKSVLNWIPISYSFDRNKNFTTVVPEGREKLLGTYKLENSEIIFLIGKFQDKETAQLSFDNDFLIIKHKTRNGFMKFILKRI